MSWDANAEKLLCLVVLGDNYAKRLSERAGDTFFRAFIVQNRETGIIQVKYRFMYEGGDRSWSYLEFKKNVPLSEMKEKLMLVIRMCANMMGTVLPESAFECFEPPDDEGDVTRTLDWLVERDLIEVKRVELAQ